MHRIARIIDAAPLPQGHGGLSPAFGGNHATIICAAEQRDANR